MRVVAEANGNSWAFYNRFRRTFPTYHFKQNTINLTNLQRHSKFQSHFAHKPLKVLRSQSDFVTLMLGFPNILGSKDVFDAFELAYSQSLRGARKSSRNDDIYNKMI